MSDLAETLRLQASIRESRSTLHLAVALVVVATLCRLAVAATLPVGVDEAYAIGVARQFSLSYFDHPPLHFWIVGGWARLWGSENLLLLRLPFVALGAISTWLMFRLGRQLFGDAAGLWAASVFSLAPVFGVAHGTLVLPDGPLICTGLAMANVVASIVLEPERGQQTGRWLLAGLFAGLAMLSKYHGVLMVAGVFIFLVTSRRQRAWLLRPGPWLSAVVACVMFLPAVVWNAQHDWVSFGFQAGRGNWGEASSLLNVASSLLQQATYLTPWLAIPLLLVLIRALAGGPARAERWLLACLAILPIAIFTAASATGRGLPHWQMPGWLFTIPLLGEAIAGLRQLARRIVGVAAALAAVLVLAFVGAVVAQARWGTFEAQTQALSRSDPTNILYPWDPLRLELEKRNLPADDHTFIAAFNWIRAAELNAVFGRDIPVLCICDDARHFSYLRPPSAYAGWTGILIDSRSTMENEDELSPLFASLTPAEDVSLMKAGRVAVRLFLRVGTDFRPPAP